MGSVNKLILVGNLGKDADVRYIPSGTAIAKFSMATTEKWTDKSGGPQERTEWHNIELWGKQAESLKDYLTKGKQIYVEGRLQSRKVARCRQCDAYFPDRDFRGNSKEAVRCPKCSHEAPPYVQTLYDVRAEKITLLGGGSRGGSMERGEPMGGGQPAPVESSEPLTDDDIPF